MDDELIDSDRLSLSRRSLLPGAGFFYPDSLDEGRAEAAAREAIDGAEVIVVTDSDADGLGCVALLREAYDAALDVAAFEADIEARLRDDADDADDADEDADEDDEADELESSVALLAAGPHSLVERLEWVAEYAEPNVDVFVCDLSPDSFEPLADPLATIAGRADRVSWYDHHRWEDDVAAAVRAAGVELVVGDSEEECSTDVTLRSLDYDFPGRFTDLAAATRDHDLWLKEDPRSDDLADYAYWTGAEEYATVVGAYGADLPPTVEAYVEHRRVEKTELIEKAATRAEFKAIGDWTVGVTYGRCSQNEVADALRDAGADASVVVKPSGSASLRGSEEFAKCHLVARQVNGGGHPKASGCKPDIYDDMLDYAYHWTTEGEAAKRVILQAFRRVADGTVAE
ncbi:DHH family phosphoesterase [Haloferacaceae archaeon DSL9]